MNNSNEYSQNTSKDIEGGKTTPPAEIHFKENDAFKWAAFALFAALSPFLVFLLPKIAGPVILFGAVVFCAIFLFSDQKSNFSKSAIKLWEIRDTKAPIRLKVTSKPSVEDSHYYLILDIQLPQFSTKNFIVNTGSEGWQKSLEKLEGSEVGPESSSLVHSEANKDVILVFIDSHRYWCRPWNFQFDISQEIDLFESESSKKK